MFLQNMCFLFTVCQQLLLFPINKTTKTTMYLCNYLITFLIRHVLAKHVFFVYCLSTAASFSCQQNITVLNQNIMS